MSSPTRQRLTDMMRLDDEITADMTADLIAEMGGEFNTALRGEFLLPSTPHSSPSPFVVLFLDERDSK